jgi:hypothetical protein
VEILRCLEIPVRLPQPVFVPPADDQQTGFGGRLALDLEPALAAFPVEAAEPILRAAVGTVEAGGKPTHFAWSADLVFTFPAAVWGQKRPVEKDTLSGSLEVPPRDDWRLVFSLQPQFDDRVGGFLKDYGKVALHGLTGKTARELKDKELLKLAENYTRGAMEAMDQAVKESRKLLHDAPPKELEEALDGLHKRWEPLSAAVLQPMLSTKSWHDLSRQVKLFSEAKSAEYWNKGQTPPGKRSSKEAMRSLVQDLGECHWIEAANDALRAEAQRDLISEELRILDGGCTKSVALDERRFLAYRRDALKRLWLRKLCADGANPTAVAQRLCAEREERDPALGDLPQQWAKCSLAEVQQLLNSEGDESPAPRSAKPDWAMDKLTFRDYRRDVLQHLLLQKTGAELAAQWQQVVRRRGYWLEVRVVQVTCRGSKEDPSPFLRGVPEGQKDDSPPPPRDRDGNRKP